MGEVVGEMKDKYPPSSSSSSWESENEEIQRLEHAPPFWRNRRKLSKQLSMCETPRDVAWERRRRQILHQERRKSDAECLTDDDLNELKGCIELGFGFKEEEGQRLCNTLPALDLYFAVNRQYSFSPVSTPGSKGGGTLPLPSPSASSAGGRSSSLSSPGSDSDSWKICSPGSNVAKIGLDTGLSARPLDRDNFPPKHRPTRSSSV